MQKIELLQNLPIQTYKTGKYHFIIKQENNGYYSLNGYRKNHKNTFVIGKWEDETIYSHLDSVKEMINYLITEKKF
jgi:hypothetical protein